MSIEAMKRIKSWLQDTKMIDSHTISAVVAECDAVILAQQPDNTACKSVQKRLATQQPATGEPVKAMPYNPTEEMRWAMKRIDPALSSEQCRALWSAAWSVAPSTHPAPSVPEFSRIAKLKLDELQKQGFTITGYAIQRGTQRGFITNGGFVGWWRSDEAPRVPEGCALVPIEPTQAMLNVQTWDFSRFYSPREIWAAMLAAREKP